ncbi:hypothetical protein Hanom_Chr05g00458841 [Helianthus anomalus]
MILELKKTHELLSKFSRPTAPIPLTDVTEFGHNAKTGFVWVCRKKKMNDVFRAIRRKV